ncbi:MAG TPA: SdpI family protein [Methanocellaceae archaeon]|jgi:hypothetical protein
MGFTLIFCGAIGTFVSILCINGKIKPNGAAGVRLNFSRNRKLYNQDKYWYDINRYGGKRTLFMAIVWILLGIAVLILPLDPDIKLGITFAVIILITVAFIIIAWQIYRYAERLVAQG